MASARLLTVALALLPALLTAIPPAAGSSAGPTVSPAPATDYCSPDFRRLLIHMAKAHKGDLSQARNLRILSGWLDLIKTVERQPCDDLLAQERAREWRARYPDHPAAGYFPDLFGHARAAFHPSDPALLLPLAGRHARFARFVLEGARDAASRGGVTLRTYDTATGAPEGAARRALDDGAGCLVGPLLKEGVRRLAGLGSTAPVLALNYLPDGEPAPPGFYQMALTPEDEARALAGRLEAEGFSAGVLLYPRGWDWAERIAARFTTLWKTRGGRIADSVAYDPRQTDFTGPIKRLLQIQMRKPTPRRRTDIDFILLLADYRLGRMLHPQLRFWYSKGLPVYASSHILGGLHQGIHYDLEGVRVTLPAWLGVAARGGRAPWDAAAYFLGESAVEIAVASGCLSAPRFAAGDMQETAWRFDPAAGRFHYRSRSAVIAGGRLQFTDR